MFWKTVLKPQGEVWAPHDKHEYNRTFAKKILAHNNTKPAEANILLFRKYCSLAHDLDNAHNVDKTAELTRTLW